MRYTEASCRQCRREGTKLFLKATKCFTEKCPVERRPTPPGQHGASTARRRKLSEYSKQLREKQKIKRIYGVSERQFRNTFERVAPLPGITGHNLLAALESRLDNVVYRMGFAGSRKAARQLVRHRHVEVNQKAVDIPSYLVQPGQEIRVRMKSREQASVMAAMDQSSRGAPLSWIATRSARRTTSGSSSAPRIVPTCIPGSSHSARKTFWFAFVAQSAMCEPRTACSALSPRCLR